MIHTGHQRLARRSDARRGFTFVELMVVLVIVGIIASLSAVAAVQIIAYARASNTQASIQTLNEILSRQRSTAAQQARKETIPQAVMNLAGGDQFRAQVIWIKLRLKQEFPMNFSEALYPWALPPVAPAGDPIHQTPIPPGNLADPLYGPNVLPAKTSYAQALCSAGIFVPPASLPIGTLPPASGTPKYSAAVTPRDWPAESAVLLFLALQENRDGTGMTSDDLSKLGVAPYIDPTTGQDTGLKMLVDGWGQPLSFYRWPTPSPVPYDPTDPSNSNNRDVDNSCPAGSPASFPFRDPDDSGGTLLNPTWNNSSNWTGQGGVFWFELHCHSIHEGAGISYAARAYYMTPVIVSAGRDNLRGFAQPLSPAFNNPVNSPLLPDSMCIDAGQDLNNVGYHNASFDNLLSYRLRQGGRGE